MMAFFPRPVARRIFGRARRWTPLDSWAVCVFEKVQSLYLFHARPSRWPCLFMLYFLAAVVVVGVSLVIFYGAEALRKLSVI